MELFDGGQKIKMLVDFERLVKVTVHFIRRRTSKLYALEIALPTHAGTRTRGHLVVAPEVWRYLDGLGHQTAGYAEIMIGLWCQARQETAQPEGTESVYNFGCDPDLWPKLGKQMLDAVLTYRLATPESWPPIRNARCASIPLQYLSDHQSTK